jgi:hypothetical protein
MTKKIEKYPKPMTCSSPPISEVNELIELSALDTKVFVQCVLEPVPVNERLRETIRRYREAIGH